MDDVVREQLLAFAERTVEFVGVCDGDGHVLYLNEAARKRLGVGDSQGLTTADLFPPEAFARYYDEVRPALLRAGVWIGTMPVLRASGESVPMLMSATASVNGGGEVAGLVTLARDLPAATVPGVVGDLAGRDGGVLSGMTALRDRVRAATATSRRPDQRVALVRIAIRDLREISGRFGSDIADNVLRVLGYRVTQAIRATDAVTRLGSDEFAVLFSAVRDAGEALRLAEGIRDAMEQMPVVTAAGDITVSVALGVAVGVLSDGPDALLDGAAAMQTVERNAGPESRHASSAAAGANDSALHHAVSHGEIEACVQPVVDLRSDEVSGYEGLARWHQRDAGVMDAEPLMRSLASTSLAPVVDLRVARETAAVVAVMSRTSDLGIYMPVSQALLADLRLEQYLWEIAEAFGLPTERLHLQVEASVVARALGATRPALERLVDLGARLVATGVDAHSDVAELARLGFHELRLSPMETERSTSDRSRLSALHDTIRSAHGLGLQVGVAGVNSEQERTTWLDAACDLATGALFGRPVRADTVE